MLADITEGSAASEQLGPGTPLGQVDIFVPGAHQVGTVGWPCHFAAQAAHSSWILRRRRLVGLYAWPARLCGDGVDKVKG